MDQSSGDHLKGAVEALLFVSDKPVSLEQLRLAVAGSLPDDIKAVLAQLKGDYDNSPRGMSLVEIAGGWQLLSSPALGLDAEGPQPGAPGHRTGCFGA